MNLDEAKAVLSTCTRSELRDHAFGDCEVYWEKDGRCCENGCEVAHGYFGSDVSEVTICKAIMVPDGEGGTELGPIRFTGDDAQALRSVGYVGAIERNDSTGPSEYREGDVMPGLTNAGVLAELTTPCRRCVECEGEDHHFSDAMMEGSLTDDTLEYVCKHCPARAKACDCCCEAIWPAWSSPLCRNCNAERIADEDARGPETW